MTNEATTSQGKGGGPKTPAGKKRSSRNAVKHGIMSAHPVIIEGHETIAGWERFRDGIVESLAPEGPLEKDFAQSIALLRWRLKRVTHYETAVINHQYQGTQDDLYLTDAYMARGEDVPDPEPRRVLAHQQKRVIPQGSSLDNVIRYEAHLHRLCLQTLHELEAMQARRLGQPSHLARVDFSSPPAQFGSTARPALPKDLEASA